MLEEENKLDKHTCSSMVEEENQLDKAIENYKSAISIEMLKNKKINIAEIEKRIDFVQNLIKNWLSKIII